MLVRMERRRRRRRGRGGGGRREDTWKTRMGNPGFGGHKKEMIKKTITKMWTRSKGRHTQEKYHTDLQTWCWK
jgi:hypothetical protein